MGLKHLKSVEELLKKNKKSFSISEIKDSLNMNFKTALDVLDYLFSEKKIAKIKIKGKIRYQWREK